MDWTAPLTCKGKCEIHTILGNITNKKYHRKELVNFCQVCWERKQKGEVKKSEEGNKGTGDTKG